MLPRKTMAIRTLTLVTLLVWLMPALAESPCQSTDAIPPPPPGYGTMGRAGDGGAIPSVAIEVRVPAESPPGEEVKYSLLAENSSSASAHHVLVKATLSGSARVMNSTPAAEQTSPEGAPPEKATVLAWKLGTLAPGQRRELKFSVMPTGTDAISCCARVQFEHGQCVRTRISKSTALPPPPPAVPPPAVPSPMEPPVAPLPKGPDRTPPLADPTPASPTAAVKPVERPPAKAALQMRLIAPKAMALHETIPYRFDVSNIGQATARKVILEVTPAADLQFQQGTPKPSLSTPLTWDLGDIEAGASRTIDCDILSFKPGSMTTRAMVKAAEGLRKEEEHTIVIGEVKLAVFLSGPSRRVVGRDAMYRITVRNMGDVPATGVELSDEPIADAKLVGEVRRMSASSGGKIDANVVRWNLGTLALGGEQTVHVVLRAQSPGKFTYVCTAKTKSNLQEKGQATTQFFAPTGLDIELDRHDAAARVKVGGEVAFALRARNASAKADTNLDVAVTVPLGLELIEVKTAAGSIKPVERPFHLPRIGRLEPRQDITAILRFRAIKPGPVKLQVQAVSDLAPPDKAVRVEESVDIE